MLIVSHREEIGGLWTRQFGKLNLLHDFVTKDFCFARFHDLRIILSRTESSLERRRMVATESV